MNYERYRTEYTSTEDTQNLLMYVTKPRKVFFFLSVVHPQSCKQKLSRFFSSSLEVEELDSIDENKEEQYNKTDMGSSNSSKEVIIISVVLVKVLFYCNPAFSSYFNFRNLVAYLRCHKTVDCPSHW